MRNHGEYVPTIGERVTVHPWASQWHRKPGVAIQGQVGVVCDRYPDSEPCDPSVRIFLIEFDHEIRVEGMFMPRSSRRWWMKPDELRKA